jgi:hypothetical protein
MENEQAASLIPEKQDWNVSERGAAGAFHLHGQILPVVFQLCYQF